MARNLTIALLALALVAVVLLVTVNVTKCDTFTGPLGNLRFQACTSEPLINPSG